MSKWSIASLGDVRYYVTSILTLQMQRHNIEESVIHNGYILYALKDKDVCARSYKAYRDYKDGYYYYFDYREIPNFVENCLRTAILAGLSLEDIKKEYDEELDFACWYNVMLNDNENLRKVFSDGQR